VAAVVVLQVIKQRLTVVLVVVLPVMSPGVLEAPLPNKVLVLQQEAQ